MKLIVGLGNPEKKYENTRHNAGFRFLDAYAKEKGLIFQKKKYNGIYVEFNHNGEKVILLKPQSYMNLSGEVIQKYLKFYKIKIADLLIICDDLDTKPGTIKLKYKGSSGGHNGLKNIENHLKTQEYKRLKIGVGKEENIDKINYVIGIVKPEELEKINEPNKYAVNIIDDYLTMSFDNLMNKYNKKG